MGTRIGKFERVWARCRYLGLVQISNLVSIARWADGPDPVQCSPRTLHTHCHKSCVVWINSLIKVQNRLKCISPRIIFSCSVLRIAYSLKKSPGCFILHNVHFQSVVNQSITFSRCLEAWQLHTS